MQVRFPPEELRHPKTGDTVERLEQRLLQPLNGSRNIWWHDISPLLRAHGIEQ